MMATGTWLVGALFCLVGTVVLVAALFVALRWFLDQGRPHGTDPAGSLQGPAAERIN